jgi:hypothetical protein
MIEGTDQRSVKGLVLLRRRFPQQEWIDIQRYVVIKEWNCEINFLLREGKFVMIIQSWSD